MAIDHIPDLVWILRVGDMICDLRTFTVAPGRFAEFIDLHTQIASPILQRHLGIPIGYWSTLTGELNRFVHLWRFDSLHDHELRYAALASDPEWRSNVSTTLKDANILLRQESVLLREFAIAEFYPGARKLGVTDDRSTA